jgi:osmotically-inducible protein OsmY
MTRGFRFRLPARTFLAASVAFTLLAGCAAVVVGTAVVGTAVVATDRRTSGAQVDDETIARKASGRLDEAFPDGRVSVAVTSYNRMVLLTGEVPSEADKTTVEQVVARIDNVVSVVNELNVGPPATFMERSRDTLLTSEVKASIVDAKDLISNAFTVVTHRRVVYLMGRVTEREANRAAEVARGVSGVAKVVKVFEIITEAELANLQPKAPAKPASSANAASSP